MNNFCLFSFSSKVFKNFVLYIKIAQRQKRHALNKNNNFGNNNSCIEFNTQLPHFIYRQRRNIVGNNKCPSSPVQTTPPPPPVCPVRSGILLLHCCCFTFEVLLNFLQLCAQHLIIHHRN